MKFTSKKELVKHYVKLIKDTESVKKITIIIELNNWEHINSTFCPQIKLSCPTKKDRIIKECWSMIRKKVTTMNR